MIGCTDTTTTATGFSIRRLFRKTRFFGTEEVYEYDVNGDNNELKCGTANNRLVNIVRTQFDTDPVTSQAMTDTDPSASYLSPRPALVLQTAHLLRDK